MIKRWKIWGFSQEVASGERRAARAKRAATHAGDVGWGAGMVARKVGRNLRGRDAGSRRPLGGHRAEADLWSANQLGPGRTGAGTGAGATEDLWGEGDARAGAVLEDCGGRARVGDFRGGRGLGRLGSFEHAALSTRARLFVSRGGSVGHAHGRRRRSDGRRNCESLVGEGNRRPALSGSRRARFQKDRQRHSASASDTRHRAPGNGCGWGPKAMGKAETASRNKNVSGAADSGESRDGGTRAVSFSDPSYFKFRRTLCGVDVPLGGRPPGQAGVSTGRA